MFKLNKCLNKDENDINKNNNKHKLINKKKLKRRYFNKNIDYFKFCKKGTMKIYIVDTSNKSGKIVVYYGPKLGRPPKNKKTNSKRRSS